MQNGTDQGSEPRGLRPQGAALAAESVGPSSWGWSGGRPSQAGRSEVSCSGVGQTTPSDTARTLTFPGGWGMRRVRALALSTGLGCWWRAGLAGMTRFCAGAGGRPAGGGWSDGVLLRRGAAGVRQARVCTHACAEGRGAPCPGGNTRPLLHFSENHFLCLDF